MVSHIAYIILFTFRDADVSTLHNPTPCTGQLKLLLKKSKTDGTGLLKPKLQHMKVRPTVGCKCYNDELFSIYFIIIM